MQKIIIAAIAQNNVIGNKNKMPWKLEEELKFFKQTTLGNAVLMGNNTFLSIGKPLNKRINIVLSKSKKEDKKIDNLHYFNSIDEAISFADNLKVEKLFVIGGESVFYQTINLVDELIISKISVNIDGDKFFPKIDCKIWELNKTENYSSFSVEQYGRKKNG
jgi:dihydrofolate reductase